MSASTMRPEPEFTLDPSALETDGATVPGLSAGKGRNRSKITALVVLALVAGSAICFLWLRGTPVPQQAAMVPAAAIPAPPAQPEPAIEHPVAPAASGSGSPQSPLPALDASDVAAKDAIETILNGDTYMRLLAPTAIIRHIVATIDNLPRKTMAARIWPVMPAPGTFATTSAGHGTSIAPGNAGRYATYVKAAESIDSGRLVQFYVRLYPLFQQAYVELGYPDGYFNDRLIAAIDHLLTAPEPKPPIHLSQPRILFEFADPGLEELSAGQKILVRVGIDNEKRLKAKLREIRKALTANAANP